MGIYDSQVRKDAWKKKRRYLCSDMPETIDFTDFLGSASMVHLFEFFVVPILTTGSILLRHDL